MKSEYSRPAGLMKFICHKCKKINYSSKWPWSWPLSCDFCGATCGEACDFYKQKSKVETTKGNKKGI